MSTVSDDYLSDYDNAERLAYSPAEAARLIGIGRTRLYELLQQGVISSVRCHGRRLIRREALIAFLDSLDDGVPGQ